MEYLTALRVPGSTLILYRGRWLVLALWAAYTKSCLGKGTISIAWDNWGDADGTD